MKTAANDLRRSWKLSSRKAPYGYGQDRQESRVAGVEQCLHQLGPLVITHFFSRQKYKTFSCLENYFSWQCLAVQVACNYAIASLQRWHCIALAGLKCRGNVLQIAVKQLQIFDGRTSSTAPLEDISGALKSTLIFLPKTGSAKENNVVCCSIDLFCCITAHRSCVY